MNKLLLVLLICLEHISYSQDPKLKHNFVENVVASKIFGTWKIDVATSTLLAKSEESSQLDLRDKKQKKEKEKPAVSEIQLEFILDTTIIKTIPAEYNKFLDTKTIFAAGRMNIKDKNMPFILIELDGNMHIMWFRERDGKPMGDSESFIVTIAAAKDKLNDLLFIGGDFNNQPFKAFKRVK